MNVRPIQLIPGSISCLRIVIGLAFPWIPAEWRLLTVAVGGLTDLLDGLASRLLKAESHWGQVLDPIADKLFYFCVAGTLLIEGSLLWWEALLVGVRDVAMLIACVVVVVTKGWSTSTQMRPRLLGKLTTALQIVYVIALLWDPETLAPLLLIPTAVASFLATVDYCRAFRAA